MNFVEIIEHKKNGLELSREEIAELVRGAAEHSVPDYQLSALLMAIRLCGMSRRETVDLTLLMAASGKEMDASSIKGVVMDKHSTGGVGDTTTLVLVPLVAACGGYVMKYSGRGLGHTGGTVDKMESIPDMRVEMTEAEMLSQVKKIGCAVVGQSKEMVPADKTLYALRDVTSTVDSLPLIASSIMSKKLASRAKVIVLDVKAGSGAIMKTVPEAIKLAEMMVRIGIDAGVRMTAFITDMAQPLGTHVGNSLEVKEAIDLLSGRTKGDLLSVSLSLGSRMLSLGGLAENDDEARKMLLERIENGAGIRKLKDMISAQGGDSSVCDDVSKLPQAKCALTLCARRSGYIAHMDAAALGMASVQLGAGRMRKEDSIDYSAGFVLEKRIGDYVKAGDVIARIYSSSEDKAEIAAESMTAAIEIADEKPQMPVLIHAIIDENGTHFVDGVK
ncbi:MAG: thymidine phosphorylase [Eubacteriales bacterium]|nr:thymidine phosphorylase [Eubacteriales bacterium]MDD3882735.1 thymidine phosphorylase [Eubacteriales bacterium]MDD4512644.1 thymidine phosphorylase [Eubacteriales bacterium]